MTLAAAVEVMKFDLTLSNAALENRFSDSSASYPPISTSVDIRL
jgi:hypothetical protein